MEIQPVHLKGDQSWVFIGLMLKLKLQYFGHLMWRDDSLEKTLMLGEIGGRRRRGWQRMRWLDGITNLMDRVWVNSGSWWWTGRPGVLWFMGSHRVGHDWVTELNCNTDLSKSYNRVCPRSKSCDVLRALMSVATNLCCDETELRSIYSPDIYGVRFKLRFNLTETTSARKGQA